MVHKTNRMTGPRTGRPVDRTILARCMASGSIALALAALGGCSLAGPTYGTGTPVGAQLVEDLSSVTTLRKKSVEIDYKPRPTLVPPPQGAPLPAPQESVASSDPAWQNSPEALRERLAAENGLRDVDTRSLSAQSKAYDPATGKRVNMRKRAAGISDPSGRRLLSDPPVEYRTAASTAPTGDLGVPEYKKERARAKAAGKDEGFSWRKLLPF